MKTLSVDLGDRSYPIFIGENLLSQAELLTPYLLGHQVMIVTNTTIAPLYLQQLRDTLAQTSVKQVDEVVLPDGEAYKNIEQWTVILDALMQKRHNRTTTIIALGGGVIGDISGFAAASYQRGVGFIQIPTTLLSQVDSSVGGKTAVNHPEGKNMIGAFYQPRCVIADTTTLSTLPDNELSAGIAEVIKYGLIDDSEFFGWLEDHMNKLTQRDTVHLIEAISRCCANKARIVAADEREKGARALLNLGHTFGHAIEAHQGYGAWLHGEAVATGMVLAADMSQRHQWLSAEDCQRIEALLVAANLPTKIPANMSIQDFDHYMSLDKKVESGQLKLILLKAIGDAFISQDFEVSSLKATLEAAITQAN